MIQEKLNKRRDKEHSSKHRMTNQIELHEKNSFIFCRRNLRHRNAIMTLIKTHETPNLFSPFLGQDQLNRRNFKISIGCDGKKKT